MSWIDRAGFVAAVEAAIRAPSMHNSQPWRFRLGDDSIEVWVDPDRALPVADATGWAARVGCGAAVFNLRLALAVRGTPAAATLMPERAEPDLLARLTPEPARPATPVEQRLYRAIADRHSNRSPFVDKPVPVAVRAKLMAAARAEQAWLDLLMGPVAVEATAAMVHTAQRLLDRDDSYRAELRRWTRADEPAADGVAASAGGPAPRADELLARRDFGGGELPGHRDFEREPLLAVLSVAGDWPTDQVQAGQALQRVLLTATELGLAASMFSQPIEVAAVREQMRAALGRRVAPQMLLRFGYANSTPPSPRRPVADVII